MRVFTFLLIFLSASFVFADPPEREFQECDAKIACPKNQVCVSIPDKFKNPVCLDGEEEACQLLNCSKDNCLMTNSYPEIVSCRDSDVPDSDSGSNSNDGESVTCKNDAGECRISATQGSCECLNGQGMGWAESTSGTVSSGSESSSSEETKPEPVDADNEVQDEDVVDSVPSKEDCIKKLEEYCGTEAPDLKKDCGSHLNDCVDGVAFLAEKCFSKLSDSEIKDLKAGKWTENGKKVDSCCKRFDDFSKDLNEIRSCLLKKSCEECMGGDKPVLDDPNSEQSSSEKTGGSSESSAKNSSDSSSDNSSSGCALILF